MTTKRLITSAFNLIFSYQNFCWICFVFFWNIFACRQHGFQNGITYLRVSDFLKHTTKFK